MFVFIVVLDVVYENEEYIYELDESQMEVIDTGSITNIVQYEKLDKNAKIFEIHEMPAPYIRSTENNDKFVCECGKGYNTEASIRYHKYECGREPSFQCPHCHYKGKRKTTLAKHIKAKHI